MDKVMILPAEGADINKMPKYMSIYAAGADLYNHETGTVLLKPGQIHMFSVGFSMALPTHLEAQIRPRSGLACKHGVTVVNAPGTIDADYRGPVKVALINLGKEVFEVTYGMRIAQMVIARYESPVLEITNEPLSKTERGSGGFGSTGS